MKKLYETLEMEICYYDGADIVTGSPGDGSTENEGAMAGGAWIPGV